jgi:hypothetical protein
VACLSTEHSTKDASSPPAPKLSGRERKALTLALSSSLAAAESTGAVSVRFSARWA